MSFEDAFALADDPTFQARTTMATIKSAIAVMSEDPATAYHQERGAYATKVLASPEVEGMNMALSVASNPAITAESTDQDIEFTVTSHWNAHAGAGLTPP